jgi:hypothetical protein
MGAAALALRLLLVFGSALPDPLPISAGQVYWGDHDLFVRWGLQAADRGVLSLYTESPARQTLRTRLWDPQARQWRLTTRPYLPVCNYPPLSGYLLWTSGSLFKAISPDRLINTPTSNLIFGFWSMACDILLAAGCAAIAGLYGGLRPMKLAYALVLFAPPFWWDSVLWGQMDSVLLAPAVWMLYAMLRERWLLGGALWGLMFALKPQAILFAPVWGFALLTARPPWKPVVGGLVAVAVILITAMPFMLTSGTAWLDVSYTRNLFETYTNFVTLRAFNIWYLNALLVDSLDAQAQVLGLTKSQWGKLMLVAGWLAGFVYTAWRWRSDRRGLLVWTALCLLLAVMLPTAVHERYLLLTLPFLGFATVLTWRVWPGLLLLTIVMMAQLSWPLWLSADPGSWPRFQTSVTREWQQRQSRGERMLPFDVVMRDSRERWLSARAGVVGYEWAFTAMALVGAGLSVAALLALGPSGGTVPEQSPGRGQARSA